MRLFCELFLVAVLVWLGWSQSFQDRFDRLRGIEPPPAATAHQAQVRQALADGSVTTAPTVAPRQPFLPANARSRPASTPSGAWMWDPAHRGTLDRGAYKTAGSATTQIQQTGPSPNSWPNNTLGAQRPANASPTP